MKKSRPQELVNHCLVQRGYRKGTGERSLRGGEMEMGVMEGSKASTASGALWF